MRRHLKWVPVLVLFLFGAVAGESAIAQHGGHGGHARGWGGGPRIGVSVGVPYYWPGYYSPYYYPYYSYAYPAPAYVYPGVAPAYVEQGYVQAAPAQPQGDWYYCADSKSYYPYVKECPGGWQRVPAQPPR